MRLHKFIEITTPENIVLQMPLATFIMRLEAFIMDTVRLIAYTLLMIFGALLLTSFLHLSQDGTLVLFTFVNIFLFVLWNGYFIYYELKYSTTPAKKSRGCKVINQHGYFLPASAIYVRNLMRELEIWLPLRLMLILCWGGTTAFGSSGVWPFLWIFMFGLVPLVDKHQRRLGDILAGTVVICTDQARLEKDLVKTHAPKNQAEPESLDHAAAYLFTAEMLDIYGKDELHILEEILRKAPAMSARDRQHLYTAVITKITHKIGYSQAIPTEDHSLFLHQFYEAQRTCLENKLVHGQSLARRNRQKQQAGSRS